MEEWHIGGLVLRHVGGKNYELVTYRPSYAIKIMLPDNNPTALVQGLRAFVDDICEEYAIAPSKVHDI